MVDVNSSKSGINNDALNQDWYTTSKNGKNNGLGYKNIMAANVVVEDTLLEDVGGGQNVDVASTSTIAEMVSTICQEVMKTMEVRSVPADSNFAGYNTSFAGKCSYLLSCNKASQGDKYLWILDSGASDHMVFDHTLLFNKRKLHKPIKVCLPDGSHKMVEWIGMVNIKENLVLYDVMLVEGFKHNLLSIGKLLQGSNLQVTFTEGTCCFEDLSKGVLAVGFLVEGLYCLRSSEHCDSMSMKVERDGIKNIDVCSRGFIALNDCSDRFSRFHARLGHISLSKMRYIGGIDCKSMSKYSCEICTHAKMHRFPFSKSNNRADCIFDLLHIDLWGPYRINAINGAKYFLTLLDGMIIVQSHGLFYSLCHKLLLIALI